MRYQSDIVHRLIMQSSNQLFVIQFFSNDFCLFLSINCFTKHYSSDFIDHILCDLLINFRLQSTRLSCIFLYWSYLALSEYELVILITICTFKSVYLWSSDFELYMNWSISTQFILFFQKKLLKLFIQSGFDEMENFIY